MSNFCTVCGSRLNGKVNFCGNCGASVGNQNTNSFNNFNNANSMNQNNILGTLVTVSLINGLTKNLYLKDDKYYTDAQCRHPFMNTAMIMGMSGQNTDDIAEIMGMSGQRLDMGTIMHNQMVRKISRMHNDRNKF